MGIQRGIEAQRCEPEFLEVVFPAVVELLDRDDRTMSGGAPVTLLEIDETRAIPLLLSARFFHTGNEQLTYILRALNGAEIVVPHEKLLPIVEELAPLATEYPLMLSEALNAYARNPDDDCEALCRKCLESTDRRVREAAAAALGFLNGIESPWAYVYEREKAAGFQGLTDPQKYVSATFMYNAEVNNGGHSQYFTNSSGENWQHALWGLKAIGAQERAAILQAACDLFPEGEPPTDREQRWDHVGAFSEEKDEALDGLNARYYKVEREDVGGLIFLYALENREHFT